MPFFFFIYYIILQNECNFFEIELRAIRFRCQASFNRFLFIEKRLQDAIRRGGRCLNYVDLHCLHYTELNYIHT